MSAEQPAPRIGNQEREQAVQALGEHYASGRLNGDEYSERVARTWEARTQPELAALFADLPAPRPWTDHRPHAAGRPVAPSGPWAPPGVVAGVDPNAPFGRHPRTGEPYSDKSKVIAGVLQLFLPFGVGRFYSGHVGIGVAQLLVTIFTLGFGALWPFVDGIVLLAGDPRDPYGRPMHG